MIGVVAPYFTNEKCGNTPGPLAFMAMRMTNTNSIYKGRFQTILVTMIISLLIKTLQPDQSNPK